MGAELTCARRRLGYETVRQWTRKVDLFAKRYIVVPINENMHWYLAILCNMDQLVPGGKPGDSQGSDDSVQIVDSALK